ncbi:Eukaryotic translation initiation factor 4E-4 [Choanephora cucurbitarum]|uniref:Eukaryotic translation initiation factor 4E-4 n=1 Tax=Choanephora cucurbitarum TaxID=101091 RepID=A0A1C7NJM3_9FUNG|nr:Eukaryotic translation initiation factor 4E-4 [Choanephora cucurbitarum]
MKKKQRMKRDDLLETTSREAFDFNLLDSILFISTLDWPTTRPSRHPYDSDEELVMIIDNNNKRFTSHNSRRRTSIQSDAYSTELIRRFSSGSTASSLSSISSSYYLSCQGDAQTHSKEHQRAHDDPGHEGCDTSMPVWADPVRVAENPTRFQYLIAYIRQQQCPASLPLQQPCLFYFSQNTLDYVNAIQLMFEVDTVWRFSSCWRTLKEYRKPSELGINQNLYCFVRGVQPMWEDPVNAKGGRLVISSTLLDNLFEWLLCAFVGGQLTEDGCVGIVVSRKPRGDRVELWFDQLMTQDIIPSLKEKLCGLLSSTCHHEINASRFKKHFHSSQ